jgi:acyl-CoA synthetase (AMP-forming)/AMP-acid ligase II/acyl carrier protein
VVDSKFKKITLYELINRRATEAPDAIALGAPGRQSLTYRQLVEHIRQTGSTLHSEGINRNDRVTIVLPNGPEMAAAFLGVVNVATCAPLNPTYSAEEFEFYFGDLSARALITQAGMETKAVHVAKKLNIPIIELLVDGGAPAGAFSLPQAGASKFDPASLAQSNDTALVLHTSGTTSRPKIVPLTQANLCASAKHISSWLSITPDDRCLNVMPLFHVHGLMASLLASLTAGASVTCTPGFLAPHFFEWIDECHPTWYTAVPTMHQAILSHARENANVIRSRPLRFIRSCSAPLPPTMMADLEAAFDVPVVEAYGMTEASHQIACNPLPPQKRKPGSVGLATGTDVAILNDGGDLLPAGVVGEIAIQGENVTESYENNPEANLEAFIDGWFRTGDQGYMDEDGYIFITGRTKEIINRGGEKISPREIDEVLLNHPAVAQVVTFTVPDPHLGETVGAAVVLHKDASVSERELREFAAERLAYFKIPSQLLFVDNIPKGPTGKLQRTGLAQKLGLSISEKEAPLEQAIYVAPRTPLEQTIARIWSEVLVLDRIGIHHGFLELGGDSLLATLVVSRLREAIQVEVTLLDFFEAPTVADMALIVEEKLLDEIEALSEDEARILHDDE